MPSYRAPIEDVTFLLQDVVGFDRHGNLPGSVSYTHLTLPTIA